MVIEDNMPQIDEECPDAYTNPNCPYVTVINCNQNDIKDMKTALIGEDMRGGIVADLKDVKAEQERNKTLNKYLIGLATSILGGLILIGIKVFFGI